MHVTDRSASFPGTLHLPKSKGLAGYLHAVTVWACDRTHTIRQRPQLLTATPPYGISMFVILSTGHNYTIGLSGGRTSFACWFVIWFRGNHKAVSVATAHGTKMSSRCDSLWTVNPEDGGNTLLWNVGTIYQSQRRHTPGDWDRVLTVSKAG